MPRTIVRAPGHDRRRSLGWLAVAWMEHFVRHGPGDVQGMPVEHGDEYTGFIVDCYAQSQLPTNNHMLYDAAFLSRPKGCDKSGLGARLALFEALGPCRFAGWARGGEVFEDPWGLGFRYEYEAGEPLGRAIQVPFVRLLATEETQTSNTYDSVYFNLTDDDCPLSGVPGVDGGKGQVFLPWGGRIMPSTASGASKDGGKETFAVFDEALALDTPLPTPSGWTTMGAVEIGDELIGADGTPVKVIKATDAFNDRACYLVTFSDGTSVVASEGHLWMTRVVRSAAKPQVRTTAEMVRDGRKFRVPSAKPWQLPVADLDIDPYVLGAWLGDGDGRNATITVGGDDRDELTKLIEQCGYSVRRCATQGRTAEALYVSLPGSHRNRYSPVRGLKVRLRDAGLLGDKHVPAAYLRGSVEQRLALVQGLMDADGHATKGGHCTFTNNNRRIVDGLVEALRSLGEDPVVGFAPDPRSRVGGHWRVTFTPRNVVPFRLRRKVDRIRGWQSSRDLWVSIKSIKQIDSVPVRCVAVDSPDHLFVAGVAGKVTHNTHLYNLPELKRMYRTVTRNLRKRKKLAGTWYLETTTMFAAGEESVAEATYGEAEAIQEGRKRGDVKLLYDHRWGEVEDLSNEEELRAGLIEAYGDAHWIDIDGLVNEFWDSRNDPYDSRRYFLNAQTNSSDAWLSAHEWDGCGRPDLQLQDRDFVTLGLDGSVNDDSTCLVACRVSDAHLELLDAWERPAGRLGEGWQVDRIAVDAAVAHAMERFEVAGFYMDPAHWQDYSDKWGSEWGEKMQVKATQARPVEWWTNKPTRMVAALERFHEAVVDRRLSFTPAADRTGRTAELAVTLRRHALNARRRPGRTGLTIAKEYPKSPKKIDAIMSAVLAFEARGDAIAIGAKPRSARVYAAKRIR